MKDPALPIVLVLFGAFWLAHNLDWLPSWHFIAVLILVVAGVLVLALEGINKHSVVAGPLLIGMGVLWLLRLELRVSWDLLLPVVPILAGALMLVARLPSIPEHRSAKARRQAGDHADTDQA